MTRTRLMRSFHLLICALVVSGMGLASQALAARNVILFIGDGMGPDHVKAGRLSRGDLDAPLAFETLGFAGSAVTTLPSGAVTDSATAATALATGYQHPSTGTISIDSNGAIRNTILEIAKAQGYLTGIVTTDDITGATPAAFGAHEESRSQTAEIRQDYLVNEADAGDAFHYASLPNVLFGGGDLAAYADQAISLGYQVITDQYGLPGLSGPRSMGLFATTTFIPEFQTPPDGQPTLAQLVTRSIQLLSASGDPFILVVESALIDKITDTAGIGPEVDQLDLSVQAAVVWRASTSSPDETLIMVTADHETGGLVVSEAGTLEFTAGAGNHTTRNVPVYATWPSMLEGATIDNIETFFLMEDFLALSGQPPVLENVAATEVTDTSALVTWTTREPSTSDLANLDGSQISNDPTRVVSHQVALTGLEPNTSYTINLYSTDLAGNSGAAQLSFETTAPTDIATLIPTGSTWKYEATGADLGTAWRQPVYDDSTWPAGPAQLGYGDGDEATLLPKTSPVYSCYYFRHAFQVADPATLSDLTLRLLRDDGAVVYLNGTEVARYSLPEGAISFGTWATTSTEYDWDPAVVIPNLLVPGVNVLAVEVHQCSSTSSDLSLNLQLTARRGPADCNAYVIQQPTMNAGVAAGDFTATRASDGTVQTLTESSRAGAGVLDAQYRLHTPADPALVASFTLCAEVISEAWDDPWKAFIWNGTAWEEITAAIRASGVFTSANPQRYIDASGTILVSFTDGFAKRKEALNSLSVDTLFAALTVCSPPTALPNPPTGLVAQTLSSSSIELAWIDSADNEQVYDVERSPDGSNWTRIAELPANSTSYIDTGLDADTPYSYRVQARNTLGASGYSNVASARTDLAPPPPAAPSNLSAQALAKLKIALTWNDNATDETGFVIERSLDGSSFAAIATVGSNTSSYTDSGLTARKVYYYQVIAIRDSVTSEPSNIASATARK